MPSIVKHSCNFHLNSHSNFTFLRHYNKVYIIFVSVKKEKVSLHELVPGFQTRGVSTQACFTEHFVMHFDFNPHKVKQKLHQTYINDTIYN